MIRLIYILPLVVFLCFTLLPTSTLAQKKGWQDVVYLKNGSIIRGDLQEATAPDIVKIETIGRNLFVFSQSEVEKVTREYISTAFKYPYTQGYLNITELGISIGNSEQANTKRKKDITLHTFNGYQFTPAFALGLTTGVDAYSSTTLLPVGLGIRGDMLKTKVRPYYGLDAGYALNWLNNPSSTRDLKGGYFWSPLLGLKFNSKKTHAFTFNIGYKNQHTKTTWQNGMFFNTEKNVYKRILFRAGLSF